MVVIGDNLVEVNSREFKWRVALEIIGLKRSITTACVSEVEEIDRDVHGKRRVMTIICVVIRERLRAIRA